MASIKTEQRQRSKNLNEMQRSYNAAEWLIRDKVEQIGLVALQSAPGGPYIRCGDVVHPELYPR